MNHPYQDLIETMEDCTQDQLDYLAERDQARGHYEQAKLILLVILILSVWLVYFQDKPDLPKTEPIVPHHVSPDDWEHEPRYVL